jgi:uridine kinase
MAPRPLVIGIAGGTASGKTTVARRIVDGLTDPATEGFDETPGLAGAMLDSVARVRPAQAAFLDQDSYYRELLDLPLEEKRAFNWDHPEAFDIDLLVAQIRALKSGEPVRKPVYSYANYAREARTVTVEPAPVLVVEGILVLAIEAVRKELDVRIFVDADDDVRVIRRLLRDVKERGRDFDGVVDQYFRTVRPMHLGFVEPSKRHADIILPHGGNNATAVRMVVAALRNRVPR